MQALLEKAHDDTTSVVEAAVEAVTDFLKASAPTPPAYVAPLNLNDYDPPAGVVYATVSKMTKWQAEAWKSFYHEVAPVSLVAHPNPPGTTADEALTAAGGWGKVGSTPRRVVEHGTGEPDVEWLSQLRDGPVTDQEVAVFLDACAERLNRFGWVAGAFCLGEYVCAVGAISVRHHEAARTIGLDRALTLSQRARDLLRAHLGLPGHSGSIERWNDTPGRTKQEVVQAFRDAAQAVKAVAATREERAASTRKWFIEPVGYQVLV